MAEWVPTFQKEHLAATSRINAECNGRFVPLVKIVKFWYRWQRQGAERPKPKGFTLEALVAQFQDGDAPTYAEAFIAFLANLDGACGHVLVQGVFPQVPDPGRSGQNLKLHMTPDEARRFGRIVKTSHEQARAAVALDTVSASAQAWQAILGNDFPTAPARSIAAMSESVDEIEEDPDEVAEREIGDTELPEEPRETVKLIARLASSKGGTLHDRYPSDGRALPKNWWLRFEIQSTSVREPLQIRWVVKNHVKRPRRLLIPDT